MTVRKSVTTWWVIGVAVTACRSVAAYRATIHRDSFGVPHIVADSLVDAAFGDGYAQAEDRLALVMENLLAASGERAAVYGAEYVERDFQARLTGARYLAGRGWERVSQQTRDLCQAFAAGINHYQQTHQAALPPNARPVSGQMVLTLARFVGLMRQMSEVRKDAAKQSGEEIAGEGSNGWVLSASRSTSGNALLLCDPHTPWSGPNRWYEKHYLTPTVNAYGAFSTGLPLTFFTATNSVAYTFTRNEGDRGDCFIVTVDPRDAGRYLYAGRWRPFTSREEIIEVQGGAPVTRTVLETVHGPVIRRRGDKAWVAGMSLYTPDIGFDQVVQMMTANNVEDLRNAISRRELDGGNVLAADARGHIFYGWLNRLMIRNDRVNYRRAVDGGAEANAYRGLLPFGNMPQSLDDPGGYYQASNTANWMLAGGAWGLRPDQFPRWLTGGFGRRVFSARPQRVVDLIEGRPQHSLEQVKEMALDSRVVAAEWVWPALARAMKELGGNASQQVKEATRVMKLWVAAGPVARATAEGYTLFRELCAVTGRGTLADVRNRYRLPEQVDSLPRPALQRLYRAWTATVKSMEQRYGSVHVKWGDINVIELADGRQFSCGAGDAASQTVWQGTQSHRGKDGKWRVDGGSDFMMAVEMSRPPQIYTLVPYGQSDDPASPHFADQTPRWTAGQWKRGWFTSEQVRAHTVTRRAVADDGR